MLLWTGIILLLLLGFLVASLPLWRNGRRGEALLAAVVLLGVSLGGYLSIGSPGLQPVIQAQAQAQAAAPEADIDTLVQRLADRLETAPDDVQGWTMLGRTYVMMGRFAEAAEAYREVVERKPEPAPGDYLNYAEALVLADEASLGNRAGAVIERLLEGGYDDPRALWYGALAAQARGEDELAAERLKTLLQASLPPSFRQIAEARLLALDPAGLDLLVTVTVDIATDVRDALPQQGTLFVSLHHPGAGGPPLAARRMPSFRYPVEVHFSPRDLLQIDRLPDGELEVRARITASDDALRTEGSLVGTVNWERESDKVNVTIDRPAQ